MFKPNENILQYGGLFFYHWVDGVAMSKFEDKMMYILCQKKDFNYIILTYDWETQDEIEILFDENAQKILGGNNMPKVLEQSEVSKKAWFMVLIF